ncbi:hypothetical protein HYFRA_00003698 [Hymenoscyphus fraxineus]|uniref:Uncharacterized protein n=1 Tax=Hymenoscyphus fraxineus TaxID=746836 RepID=A0A9N9PV54_9HELO|nr:hypothetical protein HYFRA_00003698 [Hymenoscyphus fraxineus]
MSDMGPHADSSLVRFALHDKCDPDEQIESEDFFGEYYCYEWVRNRRGLTPWELFLSEVCFFYFFPGKFSRLNWLELLKMLKALLDSEANREVKISVGVFKVNGRQYTFLMSVLSVVRQIASGPVWDQDLNEPVQKEFRKLNGQVSEELQNEGQKEKYILSSTTKGWLEVTPEEFLRWRACLHGVQRMPSGTEKDKLLRDELRLDADHRWSWMEAMSDTEMGGTNISDSDEEMNSDDTSDGDEEMYEDDLEVSGVDRKRKRFSDEDQETTEGASRLPRHFRT